MEEYIREASRVVTVPSEALVQLTCRPEEASASEDSELPVEEREESVGTASTFVSSATQTKNFDPIGWELALVTTPSNNISSVNGRQLEIEYLLGMDDDAPQDSTQYSALLAFEDYFRRDDDPPQDSTQHHSVLLDPFEGHTGEVPTSQSLEVPVSTCQSLQNVSNQQHVHTQLYQPKPPPLQSFGHNHQIIQLPTPPKKRQKISNKRCGCKASKCQKRYCECYAAGELCSENCSCQGCFNKSEYDATEKRNNNMCHNPQTVYGVPTLNPFAPPAAVQIASVARPQANSFTTSSNISPPQAVQIAAMARPRANPGIAYQPQQQQRHMLMNPTNPFVDVGHRVFFMNFVCRPPLMQIPPRLRHKANNINMYWKQLARE